MQYIFARTDDGIRFLIKQDFLLKSGAFNKYGTGQRYERIECQKEDGTVYYQYRKVGRKKPLSTKTCKGELKPSEVPYKSGDSITFSSNGKKNTGIVKFVGSKGVIVTSKGIKYKVLYKNILDKKEISTDTAINPTEKKADYEHDFRELQKASLGLSDKDKQMFHSGRRTLDEGLRGRISTILERRIKSLGSRNRNNDGLLTNIKTGKALHLCADIDAETFHDVFEIVQTFLRNGDCVDVHDTEDYVKNKNYLSSDGLSGFSITPNGDLISVFNLATNGFLRSIKDYVRQQGAKTLDCFDSEGQHLPAMYEYSLGFKTASVLEFNKDILESEKGKEYTDYFIKTYGNAPVHFMVLTDTEVKSESFTKDQYDEAKNWQQNCLKQSNQTAASSCRTLPELKDYAQKNYNINLSYTDKTDFDRVMRSFNAIEKILKNVPGITNYVQNLYYGKLDGSSIKGSYRAVEKAIYIGEFEDRENLEDFRKSVSSTIEAVSIHEMQHAITDMLEKKEKGFVKKTINQALTNLGYEVTGFQHFPAGILSLLYTYDNGKLVPEKDSTLKDLGVSPLTEQTKAIQKISLHASVNEFDCISEAVTDYYVNKDKATPLSKEIHKLVEKALQT